MSETVVESVWDKLRFRFLRWWRNHRSVTPLEMDLREKIRSLEGIIATHDETIAERDQAIKDVERSKVLSEYTLKAKIEMLESELKISAEMHHRILKKIQAETAAYAARIPNETRS